MNILILGNGARENAIGFCLKKDSDFNGKLFFVNGNGGSNSLGEILNVDENNFEEIAKACVSNNIQMVIVGPEVPLINGLVDFLNNHNDTKNIKIIGPNANGAKLEGSKAFAKEFMAKYKIPTASYKSFSENNLDEAKEYLQSLSSPYVLKADGPAAGKGVLIINDIKEAIESLEQMIIGKKFGDSSTTVVIEEFLQGIEVSYFVLTDGKDFVLLPEAKDYKRIGEEDTGPNTGGMGTVSPVGFANSIFTNKVIDEIIIPTINGLLSEKIQYKGFLFFGLINCNGQPKVIEYNCRLGDPETEVILTRIEKGFYKTLIDCANNNLKSSRSLSVSAKTALCTIVASNGYPDKYEKGIEISLPKILPDNLFVYEAGTINENGIKKSNGGRVLAVTSLAKDIESCREINYSFIDNINFKSKYYRKDIGLDLLKYEIKEI